MVRARRFLLLAALWLGGLPSALAVLAPTAAENRVRGFSEEAWGWASFDLVQIVATAPGCAGCGYETAAGRRLWLQPDPIGESGGLNLYAFVGNDPINHIDPYGLWVVSLGGNFALALGGFGFELNFGIAFDGRAKVGFFGGWQVNLGPQAGIGLSPVVGHSNAPSINDLAGTALAIEANAAVVGVNYSPFINDPPGGPWSFNGYRNLSVTLPGLGAVIGVTGGGGVTEVWPVF